jgi:hypothetical protein
MFTHSLNHLYKKNMINHVENVDCQNKCGRIIVPHPDCQIQWSFTMQLWKCTFCSNFLTKEDDCNFNKINTPDNLLHQTNVSFNEHEHFVDSHETNHNTQNLQLSSYIDLITSMTLCSRGVDSWSKQLPTPLNQIANNVYPWGPLFASFAALRMSYTPFIISGLNKEAEKRWHITLRKYIPPGFGPSGSINGSNLNSFVSPGLNHDPHSTVVRITNICGHVDNVINVPIYLAGAATRGFSSMGTSNDGDSDDDWSQQNVPRHSTDSRNDSMTEFINDHHHHQGHLNVKSYNWFDSNPLECYTQLASLYKINDDDDNDADIDPPSKDRLALTIFFLKTHYYCNEFISEFFHQDNKTSIWFPNFIP